MPFQELIYWWFWSNWQFWSIFIACPPFQLPFQSFWSSSIYFDYFDLFWSVWSILIHFNSGIKFAKTFWSHASHFHLFCTTKFSCKALFWMITASQSHCCSYLHCAFIARLKEGEHHLYKWDQSCLLFYPMSSKMHHHCWNTEQMLCWTSYHGKWMYKCWVPVQVFMWSKETMLETVMSGMPFWSILIEHQPFWLPFQSISIYFDQFDLFWSLQSISIHCLSILASKLPKYFNHMPTISVCFDTKSKSPK
jgi:hypothetical protein